MKLRNSLETKQKRALVKGGQIMMSLIFIGIFSYQINGEKGLKEASDTALITDSKIHQDIQTPVEEYMDNNFMSNNLFKIIFSSSNTPNRLELIMDFTDLPV